MGFNSGFKGLRRIKEVIQKEISYVAMYLTPWSFIDKMLVA